VPSPPSQVRLPASPTFSLCCPPPTSEPGTNKPTPPWLARPPWNVGNGFLPGRQVLSDQKTPQISTLTLFAPLGLLPHM
jgi:hypothetical protein